MPDEEPIENKKTCLVRWAIIQGNVTYDLYVVDICVGSGRVRLGKGGTKPQTLTRCGTSVRLL